MIFILIAKTEAGKYITLVEHTQKAELKKLRERMKFYCPQCAGEVLLKVGNYKIPHFSHRQQTSCRSLFSEGESVAHLAGKQQLYTFFNSKNRLKVQLEPYLKQLAQRPDLLVETDYETIPIEFQCSSIPVAQMKARTAGYQQESMNPLWILQTPKKLQYLPQGVITYSLTHFEESFLNHSHIGENALLTYNAYTKKFHYLSTFLHVKGRRFIVNHRVLSLGQQSFPFAEPNHLTKEEQQTYYLLYVSLRMKFLKNHIFYNRKGIKDPFLRNCYHLRLIPSELPLWIGIPVSFGRAFSAHDCEWQLALLYFITQKGRTIQGIRLDDLMVFANAYGRSKEQAFTASKKYVELLKEIGITSVYDQLPKEGVMRIEKMILDYLQKGMKIEKI